MAKSSIKYNGSTKSYTKISKLPQVLKASEKKYLVKDKFIGGAF